MNMPAEMAQDLARQRKATQDRVEERERRREQAETNRKRRESEKHTEIGALLESLKGYEEPLRLLRDDLHIASQHAEGLARKLKHQETLKAKARTKIINLLKEGYRP